MYHTFHRNKAIKALDERLKKSTSEASAAWPSLEDEEMGKIDTEPTVNVPHPTKPDSQSSSPDGSASPDIVTIDMDSTSAAENV